MHEDVKNTNLDGGRNASPSVGFLFTAVAVALLTIVGRAADTTIHVGMIPDAGATQVAVDQKKPLAITCREH